MTRSMYSDLWECIKADLNSGSPVGVVVAAVPRLHSRIIKAVRKRKAFDTGFAFEISEAYEGNAHLIPISKGHELHFKIKIIKKLTAEDL